MAFTPFPPRQPSSSARLPLTLMTLDDWALATISGPDSEKYLQAYTVFAKPAKYFYCGMQNRRE